MVKIRKFLLADLEKVAEIEKISFPDPWPKSYFKKLYKEHSDDFMVAELSKKVVGYILGYVRLNGSGFLKTIAVDPDYRNKGIGKKLTDIIIKKLEKDGCKNISLHTRTNNKTAHSFYKKFGFKIARELKHYYRDGANAYEMKKEI